MSARRYLSPLRYPGGKARMAPFLARAFAEQVSTLDVEIWLEPFAGGAGAALTLLDADAVPEVWLVEKHPAIAALWRTILTDGPDLAARVQGTVPDLDLWHWARQVLAAGESGLEADLAFAALVLNRCSRSGIVHPRVGPIGGKGQNGRWTLASRWNGPGLADRIRHVHSLRARIRFWQGDAIAALADLDGSGVEDEVLAFVDPPYIREGNGLYTNGMTAADHRRMAQVLNASPVRWLLTYDDEPVVAEQLYPDRRVLAYRIANTANRARIATEHAVLSDNLVLPEGELLPGAESAWVREHSHRSHAA
ncbi:DNA methyltransferase [Cellulomonas hominis]|uniref:DNA adenine methylase n=1 Tax=Cellulomonas hominis TaxID=156981 RepID=A0A511FFT4_9CELL|nr:DNA adenine methylase [Cellulomonas hominis]MBB5474849.1 DNA adenine methylase [Cellulomonas hominis]GEL48073.1 DNA methyltransferase [Cellulomonas hominis]